MFASHTHSWRWRRRCGCGDSAWWHMPHIRRGGAEIFCPLAKRHMKRIIFIIPTPTDGQFPRPSGGASTIRVQHPASNIQYPKSSRQKPASAWNPRSERTNNGVCVRKYIYLGALPGTTKGKWWCEYGRGCGHTYALCSAAAAVDTNCQFINAYRAYA